MSQSFQVKAFLHSNSHTFSYVVSDPETQLAIIIDPVLDFDASSGQTSLHHAKLIADWVTEQNLTLKWIFETHAHADHLSAAPYFKEKFNAQIAIGEGIVKVQSHFKQWFNLDDSFSDTGTQFDRLLRDNDIIQVGNLAILALHTPGHTPADMTFLVNQKAAFVGDTLFMPDVGTARCDFPGGCAHTLFDSIMRIYALGDDIALYMCHDYPGAERQYQHKISVAEQKAKNIHVNSRHTKDEFVALRQARDATLAVPALLIPAIQVNIRGGNLPKAESNGVAYLKTPLNSPLI